MARNNKNDTRIVFRTSEDIKALVKLLADHECRSMGKQVEYLIKLGLKQIAGFYPEYAIYFEKIFHNRLGGD